MTTAPHVEKKLRILIALPSLAAGGAERVGANLAKMWCDEGHEVRVVTFSSPADDFYHLDGRVSRRSLGLREPSGNLAVAVWNTARRVLGVRRELRDFDAHVAIGLMSAANTITGLAAVGTNCKAIGCEHTHPPMQPLGRARELVRTLAYRTLAAVVALTEASADWLRRNTLASNVYVIPNAAVWPLPSGEPVLSTDLVCKAGRKILLAVGRLEPVKAHDVLITAFANVAPEQKDWDLVILGEGRLRPELELLIDQLGMTGRVFLPGRVGNLDAWYGKASLFAMTSQYEGFPSSLLEAMSSGVAALSVDCDTGPRDIIRDKTDGVLVPNHDLQALQQQLASLMGNERERARLASAAQEVRDRFSEARVRDLWAELFAHVTSNAA